MMAQEVGNIYPIRLENGEEWTYCSIYLQSGVPSCWRGVGLPLTACDPNATSCHS